MAKKRRSGLLLLSIILLLLGVIIYAYRDKFSVLFNTGFSSSKNFFKEKFAKKEKKEDSNNENNLIKEKIELLEEKFNKKNNLEDDVEKIKEDFKKIKKEINDDEKSSQINDNERKPDNINIKEENIKEKQETKRTELKKEEVKYNSRLSIIYFSKVLDDDTYKLISVKRTVRYTNTPLTETLKSLLQGPNTDERSASIITNIPTNTKILSVYIKNNIAYIDLSKDFQYNSYGRESTLAQLKQIVYTTTEFSNISSVQFLIEGKVQTYLGGEGVLINKPLSRNDFS